MTRFEDGSSITNEPGGTVFAGPTAVELFRLTTLKVMIESEIRTGGRVNPSVDVLEVCNRTFPGRDFGRGKGKPGLPSALTAVCERINDLTSTVTP